MQLLNNGSANRRLLVLALNNNEQLIFAQDDVSALVI
jgi:hypothetical protein